MLLELDDDSLHAVCDFLPLADQIILSNVCMNLRDFMEERFRRKCKKISFFSEFWRKEENVKYVPALLEVTVDTVKSLEITGNLIMANKNRLESLTFSKVTTLYLSLRRLNCTLEETLQFAVKLFPNVDKLKTGGENLDDIVGLVAELYPNLKKLKMHDQLTGVNMVKLQNVEEMFIHTGTCHFDGRLFSQLLRAPRLKSLTYLRNLGFPQRLDEIRNVENLQELTVPNSDFESLKKVDIYRKMKNLQKITTYEYPLFYTLNLEDKYFFRQIDGFSISRRYSSALKLIVDAPKLRRIWINRDCNVLPDFCGPNSKHFYNLEEFHFVYSRAVEETQHDIMTVVSRSPKLRLLDVSGTKFNVSFVETLINVLKWKKRTNELTLRCHKTKITNEDLQCLDLPRHLKISFEKVHHDLPHRNIINFQIYLKDEPPFRV